ncbi:hypothetical protein LCGC14_3041200, partial [marine sediment metagenome]
FHGNKYINIKALIESLREEATKSEETKMDFDELADRIENITYEEPRQQ